MTGKKKLVFVTGGTGLVGSHLLYRLILNGERVRAVHRKTSNREMVRKIFGYYSANPSELYHKIEWVECDVSDYERLLTVMNGVDLVYHCAASVSFESGQKDSIFDSNVTGTANIVRACLEKRVEKLCHVSSVAAIGASDMDSMVNETKTWSEKTYHQVYGISKYLSEKEVWNGIEKGLNAVIVNPVIILGPGDWSRGSASLFSNVDRGLLFYTNGTNGYVDVNDVVKAMITLTESQISGERFIISSENLSYHRFLSLVAGSIGARKPFVMVPKLFSSLGYLLIPLLQLIAGKKIPLTTEILKSAFSKVTYDNSKIIERTGISFQPVEKSIEAIGAIYVLEKKGQMKSH